MLCRQKCFVQRRISFRSPSQSCNRSICAASLSRRKGDAQERESSEKWRQKAMQVIAVVAIGMSSLAPAAFAEIQTVAPQDATSFAKPLKSQPVNKSRIWGLFLLGATALFGGAVALERNSSFFPAISKANQALAATKEAQKKRQAEEEEEAKREAIEVRSEEAVLQGLADARANTGTPSPSGQSGTEEEPKLSSRNQSPASSQADDRKESKNSSDNAKDNQSDDKREHSEVVR